MNELYELKEVLCKELKEYGKKGELSTGSLDVVDKLAHTIKNLDKIIEVYETEGHSGRYPYWMGSYDDGRHIDPRYSEKRDSMGRYSRRYSRDGGMVEELRELMKDAPDERTRQEFQRFISKIESM